MKQRTRNKLISMLLVFCMLLSLLPATVSANMVNLVSDTNKSDDGVAIDKTISLADYLAGAIDSSDLFAPLDENTVPPIIGYENAISRNHVMRLYDDEAGDLNKIVFLNIDGSKTMYTFNFPVKYVDSSGAVRDIRLTIADSDAGLGEFVTEANSAITTFSSRFSDGIRLSGNNTSIKLIPILPHSFSEGTSTYAANSTTPSQLAQRLDEKTITYRYDESTTVEYSLTYTGFKEDIVVTEYTGQTTYPFRLYTNGLALEKINNSFYLVDEDDNIRATIGDIIIFTADERNNAVGTIVPTTLVENEEYILNIIVDDEYLSDPKTVYPIRIDPTIEINYDNDGAGAIEDITISTNTNFSGSYGSLYVGRRSTEGIARILMRFPGLDLSGLGTITVSSATVLLRDLMCEDTPLDIYCHAFTGSVWDANSATWDNVNPNSYSSLPLSSNTLSYSIGITLSSGHYYPFDITTAVQGWVDGNYSQDKGIIFKVDSSIENGSVISNRTFGSYNRASYKPALSVTYTEIGYQLIDDDIYYFNNQDCGMYLQHSSSGNLACSAGLLSNLGNTIQWEVKMVPGGYVIRSVSDRTKYLGVPSSTTSSSVEIVTVSDSALPARCIWSITTAAGEGCLIKNNYNARYLYTSNGALYTHSATSIYGTTTYKLFVWRVVSTSKYGNNPSYTYRELTSNYSISDMRVDVNETLSPTVNPYISNTLWIDSHDFDYRYSLTDRFTVHEVSNTFTGTTRGPAVTVVAIHKTTGYSASFEVTVNSKWSTFLSKLNSLYSVAYAYKGRDKTLALETTFNFIRGQKYNSGMWPGVAGAWDSSFVSHIQSNYPTLYNYFICDTNHMNESDYIITIPDTATDGEIDILHMAATLNRHFYTGSTTFYNFPTFGLLDAEVDDLCGWAGDFQALIRDYYNKGNIQTTQQGIYQTFYPMIGHEDYFCPYSDIITDIDAYNLYRILLHATITSGLQLEDIFFNYYNGTSGIVAAKRFTTWIGSMSKSDLNNKISIYCNDYSPVPLIQWPILDAFSISDNQQAGFTQAYVDYLFSQKAKE